MKGGKKLRNEDLFSKNTPESFYWAGFIAADGCIGKHKTVAIGLSIKDLKHLEKLRNLIDKRKNINIYKKACKLVLSSKKMVADLERFNITPRKTKTYVFPRWLVKHKLVNHFLRGYFDGDGSFSTQLLKGCNIKQLRFNVLGTKQFIDIYIKVLEFNCKTNFRKSTKGRGVYIFECGGNIKSRKIRDFLYKNSNENIRMDRKFNIAFSKYFVNLPLNNKSKGVIGTNIKTGKKLIFNSMLEAELKGFTKQCISACCRGINKTHRNYKWKYI